MNRTLLHALSMNLHRTNTIRMALSKIDGPVAGVVSITISTIMASVAVSPCESVRQAVPLDSVEEMHIGNRSDTLSDQA